VAAGSGEALKRGPSNPSLTLTNSLLESPSGTNCSGSVVDGGGNLADDTSCGTIPGTLAGLSFSLADNGGTTKTHALSAGSNAIDHAGDCGLELDQRGAPRFDGACDSGSFEFGGCPRLDLADDIVVSTELYEECEIRVGPNYTVAGPHGNLTVTSGKPVTLFTGFGVEAGCVVTIGIDGDLQLLSAMEAAAEAGWSGP
jgi:hypothetical protein